MTPESVPKLSTVEGCFARIKDSTHCPFAGKSNIEFFESWNKYKSLDENLSTLGDSLKNFIDRCEQEHLDGFIFEISGESQPSNIQGLSSLLKHILLKLNELDPKNDDCMSKDISADGWQFTFNSQRIFVITFAPFMKKKVLDIQ